MKILISFLSISTYCLRRTLIDSSQAFYVTTCQRMPSPAPLASTPHIGGSQPPPPDQSHPHAQTANRHGG